jgi:two-component system sensor histidine kinase KdpD
LSNGRKLQVAAQSNIAANRDDQLPLKVVDGLAQVYKTPLTVILAASAGLSEIGSLSPTQAELVALIDEQARQLSDLTSRLLTTARLDAKEGEIHRKPVGVEPIIDEVLAGLRSRLASRKVVVDLEDDSLVLWCDSAIGSTIKILAASMNSEVMVSVHNFGPVIPVEDREYIFDQYSLPSSLTNRISNSGFGLSLAKRIASLHGGRVWVTSSEPEGTAFCVSIPSLVHEGCSP